MSDDTLKARLALSMLNVSGGLFFDRHLAEGEARETRRRGRNAEIIMVCSRGAVLLWLVAITTRPGDFPTVE